MDSKSNSSSAAALTANRVREQLPDDWKILRDVHELLQKQNAFCVSPQQWGEQKIVEFVQPSELKQLINLKIEEKETHSLSEIEKLCQLVIRYSVKTSHGRFHNQLFGQLDPYGLAGAWITEALNTSSYTYEVAPVFSLIETEVISTVCRLAGYDEGVGDGIFSPGGSMSNMYGVVLARYKRAPEVKTSGMFGMRPLAIFTSEESHYSLKKAAHWLGFGADHCIAVRTNGRGQMELGDLESKIEEAKSRGWEPFFVNATAGTTVLGAFDDLDGLADLAARHGLWLHVDACLGGSALLATQHRSLLKGLARANSFAWNPHKTLGAPLQCSLFITRESDLLARCNSIEVNYLFQQDKFYDVSYDTGNKSVQCGRKIDAFKFWLMLKARGYSQYGHLVDHAINMARLLEQKLRARADRFRLVLDTHEYSNVCFWYIPKNMRGRQETAEWWTRLYTVAPKIKEQMAYSGTVMVGYTPLASRNLGNFFRMVFTCFPVLEANELDILLDEIEKLGEQ
ncbi:cysteine sulfinic acid decarboxylase [Scaptodrosophila lebanonensis]|uniref:Cysteine sulfinic acid decarboxylase n=1 Tax=Drosophila lebanonensis TaxID=7225 RepID=A0A6J2UBA5_DROLE|nr:cysteine sulfinic acid decarboxylase [Scaptodrosophila lebanonensis]